jgi:hypothetical protein
MQPRNALACGLLVLLAACGGGGGNPGTCMASAITCAKISGTPSGTPSPTVAAAAPAGVYRGTTSDGRTVAVVVLENSDLWVIYTAPGSTTAIGGAEHAHAAFATSTFTAGDLRDFSIERSGVSAGSIAGTFVDKSSIAGTATFSTTAVAFGATYDISSAVAANLLAIAGSYSGTAATAGGVDNATFTVATDGTLIGQGQLGCRFSGALASQPTLNAYSLSVTFQGGTCASGATPLAGVAVFETGTRRLSAAAFNTDRSSGFLLAGTK